MSEPTLSPRLAELLERLDAEGLELEVKAAAGGLPQSLWSTLSAFANTRGGLVVLGMVERDDRLVIEGVPRPGDLLQQLANQIRNPQRISYPVSGAADLSTETVDGRAIAIVRVPMAPRGERPVFIGSNPYGGTYLRRAAGDFQATRPEVDRMMREASDLAADRVVLPWFGLNHLDRETLRRFRRRYQTNLPDSPHHDLDDESFLRAIGAARDDAETGQRGLTVAGLLMFGTDEAIREWRGRHMFDWRVVPDEYNERWDVRWTDRLIWEGNLLGAYERIFPRLIADAPTPFILENGWRTDQGPYQVALREAFINLLVHADYRETQASLIVRTDQGYRFRNPGASRVAEPDLPVPDRADPRNPELVRMFRLMGLTEEAGTGIPKILRAWRSLGYQRPDFHPGTERYEFELEIRHVHLLSDDDRAWLTALGAPPSEAEQLAMVLARHEGEVDNATLRRITGLHPADATKVLGTLRNRDLLQMTGSGRGAKYLLGAEALDLARGQTAESVAPPSDQPSLEGLPPSLEGLPPSLEGLPPSLEGLRVNDPRWPLLVEAAAPVRESRYVAANDRDLLIVRLCAAAPLTLAELARLLGRSAPHLKVTLRPLISAGRLRHLYPDQPNHPRQRYTSLAVNPAHHGGNPGP